MLLFHLLSTFAAFAAASGSDDPLISKYPGLVSWFTSNGGKIDPRITIGYDDKGIRGMIASDGIPGGTVLIDCPGSLVVKPEDTGNQCAHVENIHDHLKAGEQSKWHTYFDFDDSLGSRVPSEWRTDRRAMTELQGLPPSGQTHRHIEWFRSHCKAGQEPSDLEIRAFKIFLTRAADMGLIPMYDLMNHHNGKINTRLQKSDDGGLLVIALTDIAPNEPIYNTYARSGWESSVDVFNTYGFVEDYPQLWQWGDAELDEKNENDPLHHFFRYIGNKLNGESSDLMTYQPNSPKYEVLVLSPDIAALFPTKDLVSILGNGQRSMEEWIDLIDKHHRVLRASAVSAMQDSIKNLFETLPTTIEEDKMILASEKYAMEKVARKGRNDTNKADVVQAVEYRLAFKEALKLAMDIAQKGTFEEDSDEL
eukprot:CCRYP_005652-RA/>CCRYP_005652-RA protein AED:0.02 eAED:0.02 QI:49/0/0.5/1/1/1/2/0/421